MLNIGEVVHFSSKEFFLVTEVDGKKELVPVKGQGIVTTNLEARTDFYVKRAANNATHHYFLKDGFMYQSRGEEEPRLCKVNSANNVPLSGFAVASLKTDTDKTDWARGLRATQIHSFITYEYPEGQPLVSSKDRYPARTTTPDTVYVLFKENAGHDRAHYHTSLPADWDDEGYII